MPCTCWNTAVMLGVLFLTSCGVAPVSSDTKKTDADTKKADVAKPSVPQGPISGKTAFWEMYRSARAWAPDAAPLALESKEIPGIKNADGKAAMWSATFGSLKLRQFRTYSYSITAHKPDIIQGIMIDRAKPWSGPVNDALTFDTSDLAVDSDAAYRTALPQATAWVRKNPGKDASFTLGNASRFSGPVWYVLWGEKKSGYSVCVSAKTGAVVKNR